TRRRGYFVTWRLAGSLPAIAVADLWTSQAAAFVAGDGIHKHPEVRKWFAKHPRYQLHFTPATSSWLNQIERWFAEITRKRIRRGTFRSITELTAAIEDYISTYNQNPQPFHWIASASRIIRKVNKYKRTSETGD